MKTRSMRPKNDNLHMFVVSKLYRQNPTTWVSTLKQLEDVQQVMRSLYAPLRSAANLEIHRPGLGEKALERGLRKLAGTPNFESIKSMSEQAFALFKSEIMPDIEYLSEDFVNSKPRANYFEFEGHILAGNFHAKAVYKDGSEKLIYLHPSNWPADMTDCFIELLVGIAETRYHMDRDQVLFIDLRLGKIVKPQKRFKRLRLEISKTIELAERLRKAS